MARLQRRSTARADLGHESVRHTSRAASRAANGGGARRQASVHLYLNRGHGEPKMGPSSHFSPLTTLSIAAARIGTVAALSPATLILPVLSM
jgi:hypothetical protein